MTTNDMNVINESIDIWNITEGFDIKTNVKDVVDKSKILSSLNSLKGMIDNSNTTKLKSIVGNESESKITSKLKSVVNNFDSKVKRIKKDFSFVGNKDVLNKLAITLSIFDEKTYDKILTKSRNKFKLSDNAIFNISFILGLIITQVVMMLSAIYTDSIVPGGITLVVLCISLLVYAYHKNKELLKG